MPNDISGAMKPVDALAALADLKKFLQLKGIWYTESIEHQPELKFIRIEASIKVRQ